MKRALHLFAAGLVLLTSTSAVAPDTTVYVTKTGEKYHRDGCQYLRKSKISIKLTEAKKLYSPCSRCRPPRSKALAEAA